MSGIPGAYRHIYQVDVNPEAAVNEILEKTSRALEDEVYFVRPECDPEGEFEINSAHKEWLRVNDEGPLESLSLKVERYCVPEEDGNPLSGSYGLICKKEIHEGDYICDYPGVITTGRFVKDGDYHLPLPNLDGLPEDEVLFINPEQNHSEGQKFVPELGHCINASSTYGVFPKELDHEPNCTYVFYRKTGDRFFRAVLVALRKIKPGEVLYADYGKSYWEAWARVHRPGVSMHDEERARLVPGGLVPDGSMEVEERGGGSGPAAGAGSGAGAELAEALVEQAPVRHGRGIGGGISFSNYVSYADIAVGLEVDGDGAKSETLKFKFQNLNSVAFKFLVKAEKSLLRRALESVEGRGQYPYIFINKDRLAQFVQNFLCDPFLRPTFLSGYQSFLTKMVALVPELGISIKSPEQVRGMASWEVLFDKKVDEMLVYKLENIEKRHWHALKKDSSSLASLIRHHGGRLEGTLREATICLPMGNAEKIMRGMAQLKYLVHGQSLAQKFKEATPEFLYKKIFLDALRVVKPPEKTPKPVPLMAKKNPLLLEDEEKPVLSKVPTKLHFFQRKIDDRKQALWFRFLSDGHYLTGNFLEFNEGEMNYVLNSLLLREALRNRIEQVVVAARLSVAPKEKKKALRQDLMSKLSTWVREECAILGEGHHLPILPDFDQFRVQEIARPRLKKPIFGYQVLDVASNELECIEQLLGENKPPCEEAWSYKGYYFCDSNSNFFFGPEKKKELQQAIKLAHPGIKLTDADIVRYKAFSDEAHEAKKRKAIQKRSRCEVVVAERVEEADKEDGFAPEGKRRIVPTGPEGAAVMMKRDPKEGVTAVFAKAVLKPGTDLAREKGPAYGR